jgi:CBS domain
MDADPKTTPAGTTVGELRAAFDADSHLRSALLTDGAELVGIVERRDLPPDASPDQLGATYARRPAHVIAPERPAGEALARLDASDQCRLVVLAPDGSSLLGLVCMDQARSHFCVPKQSVTQQSLVP